MLTNYFSITKSPEFLHSQVNLSLFKAFSLWRVKKKSRLGPLLDIFFPVTISLLYFIV